MFRFDSPLMTVLNKIKDMVLLNLCTLICCIPLVTVGASLTAAHYAALKMHRDSDNYVVKNFFRSFRQNIGQSTLLWLIWAVAAAVCGASYWMYSEVDGMLSFLPGGVAAIGFFLLMLFVWLFPVQARFINPIWIIIKDSFVLACRHFGRTVLMLLTVVLGFFMWCVGIKLLWIPLLFGFSVPIYLSVLLYDSVFLELEAKIVSREKTE